jgi:hypothetical protein
MTRLTPTIQHARGMLAALTASHTCGLVCTSRTTLGDGTVVQLSCPYGRLDMHDEADRRIVQTMYANEARAAMAR